MKIRFQRKQVSVPTGRARQFKAATRYSLQPEPELPMVAGGEDSLIDVDLPDLSAFPTSLQKTVFLLQAAAEIEHALLVQYLYGAYSGPSSGKAEVTSIAVEEMSHLMTVQNLLLLVGADPHLQRQDFEPPGSDDERLFPFDLALEPFTRTSLAKYIIAESPEGSAIPQRIVEDAGLGTGGMEINRVGVLYALLGVVFGTEQVLQELAADGDEWYQTVEQLAVIAAEQYGGRDEVHLPDSAFAEGAGPRQATDDVWDRSEDSGEDDGSFRVFAPTDRKTALAALRDIGIQGEGLASDDPESHFQRFLKIYTDKFGADGSGSGSFNAKPVPSGARVDVGPSGTIHHLAAVPWAKLADLRYALMLGFLQRYLVAPSDDRQFLAGWIFAEMYHLKVLGGVLVELPRSDADEELRAAIPFNMPDMTASPTPNQWSETHANRLQSAIGIAEALLDAGGQERFLQHMLESDRRKLAEAVARQTGDSVRTQFDQVREILEWASGTGSPDHDGHGRFWNVPLDELKQLDVFEMPVISDDLGDANLFQALADPDFDFGQMPLPGSRRKLTESDTGRSLLDEIKRWIENGATDAPL